MIFGVHEWILFRNGQIAVFIVLYLNTMSVQEDLVLCVYM